MLKTIPEMISESSMPPLIAELTLKGYEAVKPEVDKRVEKTLGPHVRGGCIRGP